MSCTKSRLSPRLSALALLLAVQASSAADWTYLDTPSEAVDLHATVAVQTEHGFALLGQADVYNATARYDASAQLHSARYIGLPNDASSYAPPRSAVRMPDDGFVALLASSGPLSNPVCVPARFRADGSLLWTAIQTAPDCQALGADDSGGFWLSSGDAHVWNPAQKTPGSDWERQIDELMAQNATALDDADRKAAFIAVQKIFAAHQPMIYFAAPRVFVAASRRMMNLTPAISRPQLLWAADTIAVKQ